MFRYQFRADPAGTHWYHAHSGLQREDGVFGALIVRQSPQREPHIARYDFDRPEHTVVLSAWYPQPAITRFIDILHDSFSPFYPLSGLINGKNRNFQVCMPTTIIFVYENVIHQTKESKCKLFP